MARSMEEWIPPGMAPVRATHSRLLLLLHGRQSGIHGTAESSCERPTWPSPPIDNSFTAESVMSQAEFARGQQ